MKRLWHVSSSISDSDSLLGRLLDIREIKDQKIFLNPPNPLLYLKEFEPEFRKSLLSAKKLIFETIKHKLPIIIHGDYDADGICATAILYNFIKKELKYDFCYSFIPSRFEHGYGLTTESIQEALRDVSHDGKALFITVDSGITCFDEVDYLHELGHEVVITDHHQKPDGLPRADVIVWNDRAVGASIAWLLSKVLGSKDGTSIGLAALATVTDVQPLIGFNRSVVSYGIDILNTDPPLGLKKLLEASGVLNDKELTTYELGWVIGPRINASGRMKSALDSLNLLISSDKKEIEVLSAKLNKVNIDRQEKTDEMVILAGTVKTKKSKFILSSSDNYHEGIIGLVAGKLVKDYYMPAIVIALNEGVGKGSVRSIPGIDIIKVLRNFSDLFVDLGGHPMAAGFTIEKKNIKLLEKNLKKYFEDNFSDQEIYIPRLHIDMKIPLDSINDDLIKDIERLKPFGIGNEEPVFLSEKVGLTEKRVVGKGGNHLSMKFFYKDRVYKGILFNAEEVDDSVAVGDMVDIVFSVKKSVYSGVAELFLKDLKISG